MALSYWFGAGPVIVSQVGVQVSVAGERYAGVSHFPVIHVHVRFVPIPIIGSHFVADVGCRGVLHLVNCRQVGSCVLVLDLFSS